MPNDVTATPCRHRHHEGSIILGSKILGKQIYTQTISVHQQMKNVNNNKQWSNRLIKFRMSRRLRKMCCGHARRCVSVCLSVHGRMPTLLHRPGCNLGEWQGIPPSCVLLGGLAIGAQVALLWQHNVNAKC